MSDKLKFKGQQLLFSACHNATEEPKRTERRPPSFSRRRQCGRQLNLTSVGILVKLLNSQKIFYLVFFFFVLHRSADEINVHSSQYSTNSHAELTVDHGHEKCTFQL